MAPSVTPSCLLPKAPVAVDPKTADATPAPAATNTATSVTPNRDVGSFGATSTAAPIPLPKVDDKGHPFTDRHFNGDLLGAKGQVYDPKVGISNVPPIEPKQGRTSDQTLVFVPGMNTNMAKAEKFGQTLANKTGRPVVIIHDATFSNQKTNPIGFVEDIGSCVSDLADIPGDKATRTATKAIVDALKSGQPLEMNLYSKGAIIGGDALLNAKIHMMVEEGWSKGQVEQKMHDLIKINTEGGAEPVFPDGPQYYHEVNDGVGKGPFRVGLDPVGMGLGVGRRVATVPGKDAEIDYVHFLKPSNNPVQWIVGGHDFDRYMQHYNPHYHAGVGQ